MCFPTITSSPTVVARAPVANTVVLLVQQLRQLCMLQLNTILQHSSAVFVVMVLLYSPSHDFTRLLSYVNPIISCGPVLLLLLRLSSLLDSLSLSIHPP